MPADPIREGMHHCPAHTDRSPSLHVTRTPDGRVLLHCHAGCAPEAVLRAWGRSWGDLAPEGVSWSSPPARREALTVEAEARLEVLALAKRAGMKRAAWALEADAGDAIRRSRRWAARLRELASPLGPESEHAWRMLDHAARLETVAHQLEDAMSDLG